MSPKTPQDRKLRARIVSESAMGKSSHQLEAEDVLRKVKAGEVIEVPAPGNSTRSLRNVFKAAADEIGKEIDFKRKGQRLYVIVRDRPLQVLRSVSNQES